MSITVVRDERNRAVAPFVDDLGVPCLLSDAVFLPRASVWLGLRFGSQMLLDQATAAALLPLLQHFVETGSLPAPSASEEVTP